MDVFKYIKMACDEKGISINDFSTIAYAIEIYENDLDEESLRISRKEVDENGIVAWQELEKKLGWDKF